MAKKTRSVQVFECDAPMCFTVHYVEKNEGKPEGVHGKISEVTNGAESAQESFYACSRSHIEGAVATALERAWEAHDDAVQEAKSIGKETEVRQAEPATDEAAASG